MADPLGELNARIAELKVNLAFVTLAMRLRPRIGEVIQWESTGGVVPLAQ